MICDSFHDCDEGLKIDFSLLRSIPFEDFCNFLLIQIVLRNFHCLCLFKLAWLFGILRAHELIILQLIHSQLLGRLYYSLFDYFHSILLLLPASTFIILHAFLLLLLALAVLGLQKQREDVVISLLVLFGSDLHIFAEGHQLMK